MLKIKQNHQELNIMLDPVGKEDLYFLFRIIPDNPGALKVLAKLKTQNNFVCLPEKQNLRRYIML